MIEQLLNVDDRAAAKLVPLFSVRAWRRILAELEEGTATLLRCPGDTYAVLRTDDDELVIVALAGCDAERLFGTAMEIAAKNGLAAVRFHTERKGLGRLLAKWGPCEVETVYRVQVAA